MILTATYAFVDPSIEDYLREKEKDNPLFSFLFEKSEEYDKIVSSIPKALSMDIDDYNPTDTIKKSKKIGYSFTDFQNFKLVNLKTGDIDSPEVVYERQTFSEIKSGIEPKKRIVNRELKIWIVEIPEYKINPQFFECKGTEKNIGQLKESIKEKFGIPTSKLHVFCGSRIMKNGDKIIKTQYEVKFKRSK